MRTIIVVLAALCVAGLSRHAVAQQGYFGQPALAGYRATPERINDLVHTRLEVSFDYKKRYLYGREWITLRPHFYQTDSLRLDAKGMDIKRITLQEKGADIPLAFSYDSLTIAITLHRMYRHTENYTLCIEYTAKPNELKGRSKGEKGLYFINPDSSEKGKPVQIWTEGEPESASCWFPTLDQPGQKTTQEMVITVPSKYVTLSNGRLASQQRNGDGTRSDTWKMDQPHSPYLFMMAVGDFRIHREYWHGKEVAYYLEPDYAAYAKDIFGNTPEAMAFFSRVLGVDFPWNKYAQVVVRDYVSGAMENTSAALFGEATQGTRRQLMDRYYEAGIEHELFHQWFGDYVTAESWSHLTLNESFADLGEILWLEYKYGKDAADEHVYDGLQGYWNNEDNASKKLVEFNYKEVKEVFNGVTYQKGGRILNMLRHYLGDEAFYRGLHIYLTENAYKPAEVPQLRLAMEAASGRDLNWFFDQWYYRAGHPILDITFRWDQDAGKEVVAVRQLQEGPPFVLPVSIDLYAGGHKQRQRVWVVGKADTFSFPMPSRPQLVNFDAERALVAREKDNKTLEEYVYQYFNAPLFADRSEAVKTAASHQEDPGAQSVILSALSDKYSGIRNLAIRMLNRDHEDIRNANEQLRHRALPVLAKIADGDSNTLVRTAALITLAILKDRRYLPVFVRALDGGSYSVQGAAITAIGEIDSIAAMKYAKTLEKDNQGPLTQAIARVYAKYGGEEQWAFVFHRYVNGRLQDKIHLMEVFAAMIGRIESPSLAQDGISELKRIAIQYKKDGAGSYVSKFLDVIKDQRAAMSDAASSRAAADALAEIAAAP
ncbi:M1 family metallopeptidase [Flavitalea sp. BT771]|uniref:M1 family metallopeptidase n=1 Tax=Flavitalea sp. BT771 TaxID=3063329 RepID=UPI0026E26FF7|nr:M1 family metallopeptidase [Flavitalea sp. BT771]MDO6432601.1 M1 family metallopeptidase [Flavitalea sp. BT771]MDV6222123.1 M1 family metallopeptidase [Flavitalea sp. BT771]